jgi:hypothetical protein
VQILEAVIVFTALTTIVVVSFSLASGFALYQAVAAETKHAVGGMTQLGYGAQSIADGREATADLQFSYRYGILTYVNDTALRVILIDSQSHETGLYSSPIGRFEYMTPYTIYGSSSVQDKGTSLAPYVTPLEDAIVVYHYSANGRTHAVVQPRPVIAWHVNTDGSVNVQIFIVELTRATPVLTRQGTLRLTYSTTTHTQCSPFTGPVKIRVTFGIDSQEVTIGTQGKPVYVYLKTVQVGSS